MTIRAAGIMIVNPAGEALFLKRGPGSDYPGMWAFPGGRLESGESTIQAAIRETKEEAGRAFAEKDLTQWTRRVQPASNPEENGEPVEFTTYVASGVETFTPKLGPKEAPEHVGFVWAPIAEPPQPLHPGCAIALARSTMNELDIARAMAAGELTSPQFYVNVTLFDLRITGTDLAERKALNEIAYRDPALYLNDEFLARCNGMPVILEHPEGNILDAKGDEYAKRNIGTIMLPYIKGNEVWGIAKIFDAAAAQYMSEEQLSTSPAVAWHGDNPTVVIGGKKVLLETKPGLVDHLAVVARGVWDKGGDPTGVNRTIGDSAMADDNTAFETWKANQEAQTKAIIEGLGALTGSLKTIGDGLATLKARADAEDEEKENNKRADARKRADSFEFSKRKDGESDEDFKMRRDAEEKACADAEMEAGEPEEKAADKARKRRGDADEKEEKERADKARADADRTRGDGEKALLATIESLKAKVAELSAGMPVARSDADLNALSAVQARADAIMTSIDGSRARPPLAGESLLAYRRHFLEAFKAHSPAFKDANIAVVAADEQALKGIEDVIYNDAKRFAESPARVPAGELRRFTKRSDSGHTIYEYHGETAAWLNEFAGATRRVGRINDRPVLRNAENIGTN